MGIELLLRRLPRTYQSATHPPLSVLQAQSQSLSPQLPNSRTNLVEALSLEPCARPAKVPIVSAFMTISVQVGDENSPSYPFRDFK